MNVNFSAIGSLVGGFSLLPCICLIALYLLFICVRRVCIYSRESSSVLFVVSLLWLPGLDCGCLGSPSPSVGGYSPAPSWSSPSCTLQKGEGTVESCRTLPVSSSSVWFFRCSTWEKVDQLRCFGHLVRSK